jgi:transcriptional regulator with XRE-family HTH domain
MNTVSGAKLRALREYAGLDQTDVALKAGIDRSTFSQMETGKRRIAGGDALRIIRAIESLRASNGAKFERAMVKVREMLREEAVA